MNNFLLNKPVLFLVFNRINTTKQVFSTIREAQPPRLYIAADGARPNYDEQDKVDTVRNYIVNNIDWDCKVKTLFREKNLGCKYAVSGAIDWFFENEEMGIILEDDTLPSQSFFYFCQELLEKYRYDERIMKIAGFNEMEGFKQNKDSYLFANFGSDWGWASWSRAWKHYDVEMSDWPEFKDKKLNQYYPFIEKRNKIFEKTYKNNIDTWDYQWHYAINKNHGLVCIPCKSLVKNIGFGKEATHTQKVELSRQKVNRKEINFPLIHPFCLFPYLAYEKYLLNRKSPTIFKRILLNFLKVVNYVTKR